MVASDDGQNVDLEAGSPRPDGRRGDGGAGPTPLTGEELEQICEALARISEERFADGRYQYRSLPEQFPKEVWENPEAEIWW